jgi:hypothetical protein
LSINQAPIEDKKPEKETKKEVNNEISSAGFFYELGIYWGYLFLENNLSKLWNAFTGILVFNLLLGTGMEIFGLYQHEPDNSFLVSLFISVIFLGISYFAVNRGIKDLKEFWVLIPLGIMFLFLILASVSDEPFLSEPSHRLNAIASIAGGWSKVGVFLIYIWDQIISWIVEILLMVRIFIAIKHNKAVNT